MKFEIIVPFKNELYFIDRLCNDLESQSDLDFRVCFVSDSSVDGTVDYLGKEFNFEHSVIPSTGDGPGAARNTGIINSSADYLLFIDADDSIEKKYFEQFKNKAIETHSDVIECMFLAKDSEGNIVSATDLKNFLSNESRFINLVEGKIPRLSWGKAYRREFLIKHNAFFPDGIHNGEDHIFLMRLYRNDPSIALIFKKLYFWMRRKESLTNKPVELKTIQDFISVCEMKVLLVEDYIFEIGCQDFLLVFARRTFKEARMLKEKIISDGVNVECKLSYLQNLIKSSSILTEINLLIENDKETSYWNDVM